MIKHVAHVLVAAIVVVTGWAVSAEEASAASGWQRSAWKVVKTAKAQKGKPYRRGATGPRAFDCSGLTQYVMKRNGVKLPRTSRQQAKKVRRVKRSDRRVGDLVFFYARGRVYHVGIYAGHGRIWHAPKPGSRVRLAKIWTNHYWFGRALN